MERLIEPGEYTPEIVAHIANLKHRMAATNVEHTDDDIRVFEHEGNVYILANPVLGTESVFNEDGTREIVPMRNLTLISSDNPVKTTRIVDEKLVASFNLRIRILRPDLCIKINGS